MASAAVEFAHQASTATLSSVREGKPRHVGVAVGARLGGAVGTVVGLAVGFTFVVVAVGQLVGAVVGKCVGAGVNTSASSSCSLSVMVPRLAMEAFSSACSLDWARALAH